MTDRAAASAPGPLGAAEIQRYAADGFVRLAGAIPRTVAEACRRGVADRLAAGSLRFDRPDGDHSVVEQVGRDTLGAGAA